MLKVSAIAKDDNILKSILIGIAIMVLWIGYNGLLIASVYSLIADDIGIQVRILAGLVIAIEIFLIIGLYLKFVFFATKEDYCTMKNKIRYGAFRGKNYVTRQLVIVTFATKIIDILSLALLSGYPTVQVIMMAANQGFILVLILAVQKMNPDEKHDSTVAMISASKFITTLTFLAFAIFDDVTTVATVVGYVVIVQNGFGVGIYMYKMYDSAFGKKQIKAATGTANTEIEAAEKL